jgi:short-subunit dehydrogenase
MYCGGCFIAEQVMETNFFSAVALTKAVLPGMLDRRAGHIIVINR